ncbi:MAG: alpha-2-macroglobulin family protein, partial [Rhodobacteraceae bacterium]
MILHIILSSSFHLARNTLGGRHAQHGGWQTAPFATVAALTLTLLGSPLAAQDNPVPPRFATMLSNTDLPGGDLTPVFNTTLMQCHATCLRLEDCTGFTFNQRAGACFPKSAPGAAIPFEGAISGRINQVAPSVLSTAADLRPQLDFLDSADFTEARAQAETLANRHYANGMSEEALLQGATGTNRVLWTGAAVTVNDSPQAWLGYTRALRAQAQSGQGNSFELNRQAVSAALNATLRSETPGVQADALVALAEALEARFRGEAGLGAIRLADQFSPGVARETLVRMREEYGFRLLSHDIESMTAAPRICARFSEDLSPSRDYTPFVQTRTSGLAVEAEGRQLCISGVAYGENYSLTLRAGLPAASGDTLARDVPLEVYVRDRAPRVAFPGRGYVLPATGTRALPVETVNADQLDLRLLRVSDRNIVTAIRRSEFNRALGNWEGERFEQLLAEPVWHGSARVEGTLNRATTSRLPLDEAGPLEPGVYVLRAEVPETDSWEIPPAMQWFMVSDLGLTTLAGN